MDKVRKGYVLGNKERRGLVKQTMLFVWPRIPFTIIGTIVGVLFPIGFGYISAKFNLNNFAFVTTLGGLIGALVYKVVLTWGAREYKAAEVAIIAAKLDRNVVPEPVFRSGLTLVHTYFEAATFGRVIINLVKSLHKSLIKNDPNYPIKMTIKLSLIQLRDALLIFVLDLFPYLGCCSLYNVFAHIELPTMQAFLQGVKTFFKKFWRMSLRNIKSFFNASIIFLVTFVIAFMIMILVFGHLPQLVSHTMQVMEWAQFSVKNNDAAIVAPTFVSLLFGMVTVTLSQPIRVIKTLERFKVLSERSVEKDCLTSEEYE